MLISPGVLHSSRALLIVLKQRSVGLEEFFDSLNRLPTMGHASREKVLQLCQAAYWIQLTDSGQLRLTKEGGKIAGAINPVMSMRMQIQSIILHINPPWAKKAQHGRQELLNFVKPEIRQCFQEAKLTDSTEKDVVVWWDKLANASRGIRQERLLEIGRIGERLSINFEKERTGKEPKYVALDTAEPGYDILSIVSRDDTSKLCIEVKTSEQNLNQAYFHLSRNEYENAKLIDNYVLHLWLLNSNGNQRLIVPFDIVEKHCPSDRKEGKWESVKIPFNSFEWD